MPPRQDMKVAYMLSFISLTAIISGCITVPMDGICNDKDCYEFSAESFSDFLGQDNAFDIISYSESHAQMRVEAFLITEQENQRGEIYWNVAKDQDAGLSSVASRLVLGETVVIDNEYIEGNKTNNDKENTQQSVTYAKNVFEKNAHRDLTGFAPSFVHRAPFWTRFVKKLFRTILYYSVLFRTIPYCSLLFQSNPILLSYFDKSQLTEGGSGRGGRRARGNY